jgi:hypothetical protein
MASTTCVPSPRKPSARSLKPDFLHGPTAPLPRKPSTRLMKYANGRLHTLLPRKPSAFQSSRGLIDCYRVCRWTNGEFSEGCSNRSLNRETRHFTKNNQAVPASARERWETRPAGGSPSVGRRSRETSDRAVHRATAGSVGPRASSRGASRRVSRPLVTRSLRSRGEPRLAGSPNPPSRMLARPLLCLGRLA